MTQTVVTWSMVGLLLFTLASSAPGADIQSSQPVKEFYYPIYNEQGQLKMEISGKTARFLPDNLIQITGLRMTFYEEGKMTMQVSTPLCFFDRVKRTASSKVEVWANRVDLIIAGYGFYWSEKDGFIRINNDAMVVLKKNEEKTYFGAESAITSMPTALQYDTNNTVIISRKLAFDQKQSTVIFEGSVKVNDPALKIESDRLTVQLSNDKKVELIKAEGNVLITRDIIYAGSQLASYAVPEGKITLYGKPVINREKDSLTAETIVLWRNSNRIICEPQAHLIIYSEPNTRSQFKKD